MNEAEWMINPRNGRYLAHAYIRGMHIYTSGRNLTALKRNLKQQAYKNHLPYSIVRLSLNPTQEIDLSHATNIFMSKFVDNIDPRFIGLTEVKKIAKENEKDKPVLHKENVVVNAGELLKSRKTFKHITRVENGQLVVYKVEEVCRYDLMDDIKPNEVIENN